MHLVLRGLLIVSLLAAALSVPAHADPATCAAGDPLADATQDDAGSGSDAADVPDAPLHLPEGDFTGALQLPSAQGPGDAADWYSMQVSDEAETVMVDLQPYLIPTEPLVLFVVDVYPPDATEAIATVPMGVGRVGFEPAAGAWSFQIRFDTAPGEGCSEPSAVPAPVAGIADLVKVYGLYIGCDPVCV